MADFLTVGLCVIRVRDIGGLRMRKTLPSLSTRTEEFTPHELPLPAPAGPPPLIAERERRPADRIKEALLRWLEEEL
jgi:hypothetical protein